MLQLSTTCIEDLPHMGWLARLDYQKGILKVAHGNFVEAGKDMVVEGVWDGSFETGNFHESAFFFGSGLHVQGNEVTFVPSMAATDAIYAVRIDDIWWVANSLAMLLAAIGGKLDRNHNYEKETFSFCKGVNHYDRKFRIIHPEIEYIEQIYVERLTITGEEIRFDRKFPDLHLNNYDDFSNALNSIMSRLKANWEHPGRKISMQPFATISSGYDSVALCAILKDFGISEAYTSRHAGSTFWPSFLKPGLASDDGTAAAEGLGLSTKYLDSKGDHIDEIERLFLLPNCIRGMSFKPREKILSFSEIHYYKLVSDVRDSGKAGIVFTGLHGDRIWSRNMKKEEPGNVTRPDATGHGLSASRFRSGFIQVPLPFIFAYNLEDLEKISNSEEMRPWQIGRDYDRPIPRRMAETAGADRNSFGNEKKFASRQLYAYPKNRTLRRSFFKWAKSELGISSARLYVTNWLNWTIWIGGRILNTALKGVRLDRLGMKIKSRRNILGKNLDGYFFMWLWANQTECDQIRKALPDEFRLKDQA